jgi:hypothetical protein
MWGQLKRYRSFSRAMNAWESADEDFWSQASESMRDELARSFRRMMAMRVQQERVGALVGSLLFAPVAIVLMLFTVDAVPHSLQWPTMALMLVGLGATVVWQGKRSGSRMVRWCERAMAMRRDLIPIVLTDEAEADMAGCIRRREAAAYLRTIVLSGRLVRGVDRRIARRLSGLDVEVRPLFDQFEDAALDTISKVMRGSATHSSS